MWSLLGSFQMSGPWTNYLQTACPPDCLSRFSTGSEKDLGSNPNSATFKLCALSDSESQSPYCEGGRYGMSQGVAGRITLDNIESFGHSGARCNYSTDGGHGEEEEEDYMVRGGGGL